MTNDCLKSQKRYSFRADPKYAGILSRAGFDIVSLANNHSFDCGQIGLDHTFETLDEFDVRYVGAAKNHLADSTAVIEVNGLRIGFAGFTAISPFGSGESNTGISLALPEAVSERVTQLREQADVVVVSFHWGTEYSSQPTQEQVDLALLAVESGADIVLGHHPHVLQGIETVDRGPGRRKAVIAYSLGNFVFDSPVRLNRLVGESMIFRLSVDKLGVSEAEIIPVTIDDYRPVIAAGDTKNRINNRIEKLSNKFGTDLGDGRVILEHEVPAR